MPVGAGLADVGFLLSRTAAVGTGDVLFLFGLRPNFIVRVGGLFFCASASEGDAIENDIVYVVA